MKDRSRLHEISTHPMFGSEDRVAQSSLPTLSGSETNHAEYLCVLNEGEWKTNTSRSKQKIVRKN